MDLPKTDWLFFRNITPLFLIVFVNQNIIHFYLYENVKQCNILTSEKKTIQHFCGDVSFMILPQ